MGFFCNDKKSESSTTKDSSGTTVNCNCDTKESTGSTATKTVIKTVAKAVVLGIATGGTIIS